MAWVWSLLWYLVLDPLKWALAWILNEGGMRSSDTWLREQVPAIAVPLLPHTLSVSFIMHVWHLLEPIIGSDVETLMLQQVAAGLKLCIRTRVRQFQVLSRDSKLGCIGPITNVLPVDSAA